MKGKKPTAKPKKRKRNSSKKNVKYFQGEEKYCMAFI
jgi:hypothetical protein